MRGRDITGGLTARQHQCLALAMRDMTERQIARTLGIDPAAVHRHLTKARAAVYNAGGLKRPLSIHLDMTRVDPREIVTQI